MKKLLIFNICLISFICGSAYLQLTTIYDCQNFYDEKGYFSKVYQQCLDARTSFITITTILILSITIGSITLMMRTKSQSKQVVIDGSES